MWKLPAVCAAIVFAVMGDAQADATRGGMLAAQICAGCHAIRPGQPSPKPDAPPFATIAVKPDVNIFTLRSFLLRPHWTSANLSLKEDDTEAIASYIMRLNPKR